MALRCLADSPLLSAGTQSLLSPNERLHMHMHMLPYLCTYSLLTASHSTLLDLAIQAPSPAQTHSPTLFPSSFIGNYHAKLEHGVPTVFLRISFLHLLTCPVCTVHLQVNCWLSNSLS